MRPVTRRRAPPRSPGPAPPAAATVRNRATLAQILFPPRAFIRRGPRRPRFLESDERLMLRFQAGDVRAFEELVRRHRTPRLLLPPAAHRRPRPGGGPLPGDVPARRCAPRRAGSRGRSSGPGSTRSRATRRSTTRAGRRSGAPSRSTIPPARRSRRPTIRRRSARAEAALAPPEARGGARGAPAGAAGGVPAARARRPAVPRDRGGDRASPENTVKSRMRYALEALRAKLEALGVGPDADGSARSASR